MISVKRLVALLLLAAVLVTSFPLDGFVSFTAYASETTKLTVTGDVVNVRSGAGTSYNKISTVDRSTVLTSLGTSKDSAGAVWYKVEVDGQTGYISSGYVSASTTSGSSQTLTVTGDKVYIRKGAGTSYDYITTVRKGSSYTILGSQKDSSGNLWYRISINNTNGYIISTYVKVDGNSSGSTSAVSQKLTVTGDVVNVRKSAGTSAAKVTTVRRNQSFDVLESTKDSSGTVWYKISVNGSEGYIVSTYVKVTTVTTTSTTTTASTTTSTTATTAPQQKLTVTGDDVNVRKDAGASYTKITSVKRGSVFSVIDSKKDSTGTVWYKISVNGTPGYIISTYVKLSSDVTTQTSARRTTEATSAQASASSMLITLPATSGTAATSTTTASSTTGSSETVSTTSSTVDTTESTSTTYAANQSVAIPADGVKLYSGAGDSYSVVSTLSKGSKVLILSNRPDADGQLWYRVSIDSLNGYVRASDLSATTDPTTSTTKSTTSTTKSTTSTTKSTTSTTKSTTSTTKSTTSTTKSTTSTTKSTTSTTKSTTSTTKSTTSTTKSTTSTTKSTTSTTKSTTSTTKSTTSTTKSTTSTTKSTTKTTTSTSSSGIIITLGSETTLQSTTTGSTTKTTQGRQVKYGTVTCDTKLNVRSGPSTSKDILGTLNNGKKVIIVESSGDWYKIEYDGGYGYVLKEYITNITTGTESSSLEFTKEYYYVNQGSTVNVAIKLSGQTVSYSSENSEAAPVSDKGVVTGKQPGLYTITAKVGSASATTEIVVLKAKSEKISSMTISSAGTQFIADWEGGGTPLGDAVVFYPYKDVSGYWTVGYGHAVTSSESKRWSRDQAVAHFNTEIVKLLGEGHEITKEKPYLTAEEASALLNADLNEGPYVSAVSDWAIRNGVVLTQPQFDSLVSFCYNLGPAYWTSDTYHFYLKEAILAYRCGDDAVPEQIIDGFTRYVKSGGVNLKGLWWRRRNEAEMFITGDYAIDRDNKFKLPNLSWG